MSGNDRTALVIGATGGVGGATAAALLKHGWRVRAMNRDPQGAARRTALSGLGVDMADEALVEALSAAVLTRVGAWVVVANTPQGAAGPLAPVLGEYFDMVPLLGRQVAAVSPNGLPLAVGVFAGLDIWGRATIKTDAGEQEFPPEAVRIRGL